MTFRRSAQGLVLPLKSLDPPEKLANLPFAISELPLELRASAKRVLLIQSAVNRYGECKAVAA